MEHDSVSTHQLQRDSGTAVWWLGTQPHYKYHYRLTESAWGERVREGDSYAKWGRKTQNQIQKRWKCWNSQNSSSLSVGVMMHAVTLKHRFVYRAHACIHMHACTVRKKTKRSFSTEETGMKSDRPPSFPLFISLSAVSSDPANYHSLTVQERKKCRGRG